MDFRARLSELDPYFSIMPAPPTGVTEQIARLLQNFTEYRAQLYRPLAQVTFFGAFKAGKSTLLNALIGWPLLPSRVNRATGVITRISFGSEPAAELLRHIPGFPDRTEKIFFDDIARYILLDLTETTAKPVTGVAEVRLQIPLPLIKERCQLVDTPGLLDNPALTARTFAELDNTDLAVMVLAADKLVSQAEREAAHRAHRLLNGNLVFIVNRLDLVDDESREEVLDWAKTAFSGLGNGLVGQPHVFATEARQALEARRKNNSKLSHFGLVEFEEWLGELWSGEVGAKVMLGSRLAILDSHLSTALEHFRLQLDESETRLKLLKQQAEKEQLTQINRFKKELAEQRLRLGKLTPALHKLLVKFIDDCLTSARKLIDSDQDWSKKLASSFEPAVKNYAWEVNLLVNEAIQQKNIKLPTFNPTPLIEDGLVATGHPLEGIDQWVNNNFGVSVPGVTVMGDWLNKTVFTAEARQKAFTGAEQAARKLAQQLKRDSESYLFRVEKLLDDYETLYRPKPQTSANIIEAQNIVDSYHKLLNWGSAFQKTVQNIKNSPR